LAAITDEGGINMRRTESGLVSKLTRALDPRPQHATAVAGCRGPVADLSRSGRCGEEISLGTTCCPNEMRPSPQPPRHCRRTGPGAELQAAVLGVTARNRFSTGCRQATRRRPPALRTALDHLRSDHPEFEWMDWPTWPHACRRTNGGIEDAPRRR